ncbi:hypothetical protein P879_06241 [Paragonimus westermani]|uniref:Histone H4 n=1 Tax=Paragonimus westermani TaxID=34504 RepID=A0A8T0DGU8_9TREM|nr:hypothetical protein P879_06241 [Paragonimus westermani]
MENAERRKLNKLLRKPTPSGLHKSGSSRQKWPNRSSQKHARFSTGTSVTEAEDSKEHGFSVDVIKLCSEMCGISNLSTPAAGLLQKHLNQLVRLLIHSVLRVMEQSRRGVPQASDVDLASVLMGLEAPFGTAPVTFLPIRTGGRTATSGPGGKVFFIRPEKEIDVKALLLREPAGVVYDVSLVAHWLAVNGKQAISPQNPPPDLLARMRLLSGSSRARQTHTASDASAVGSSATATEGESGRRIAQSHALATVGKSKLNLDTIVPAGNHPRIVSSVVTERRSHEVSQEVMIYFRELTEACVGASENRRHEALDNATLDPGLQPVLPHLVTFIAEGVRVNVTNHNLAILIYLMRLVKALVDNAHISLEPYLHLLVPTVITCVLSRQLCAKPITDNHWALRDFAAKQLVILCNRYNTSTNQLHTRVTRELCRALHNWINGTNADSATSTSDTEKPESRLFGSPDMNGSLELRKRDLLDKHGPSLGTAVHSMNTLYGILVTLDEFGPQSMRVLVFPVLPALCQRLTALVEPPQSSADSHEDPVVNFTPPSRLSPADQRSFDSLKAMMTKVAPLLTDWRTRQNLGTTLDDYRVAYGCMAACLHGVNRCASATPTGSTSQTPAHPPFHHQNPTNQGSEAPPRASLVTNSSVTLVTSKPEEVTARIHVTSADRSIQLIPLNR